MTISNSLAPINTLEFKQYNLCDFCEEFSDFRSDERNSLFGCENISNNLIKVIKKDKIYFKDKKPICPDCNSKNIHKNGNYLRKLFFLNIGEQICVIQKYQCKKMW